MANEYRQEVHLSQAEYSVDFYDIHTINIALIPNYVGLEAETLVQ